MSNKGSLLRKDRKKQFFFEKKNQETFAYAAGRRFKRPNQKLPLIDKGFSVLFSKKNCFLPSYTRMTVGGSPSRARAAMVV
jgi:hypothetical protein